ncbi:MAG: HEPN domain-containing protein [Chthoniobacteraceae bacterium]
MDQALIDSTQRWLTKAFHDLVGAEKSGRDDDVCLDIAVYHCQQAGEKALKAFLLFRSEPIQKTHSLAILLPLCEKIEPEFGVYQVDAARLTPLATMFRYPDDYVPLNPTRTEFDEALAAAQRVFDFVLSLLPAETHPT